MRADELPPEELNPYDTPEEKKKRKWQPEYEIIVALSCTGAGAREIAEKVGRSRSHVYEVLAMDEAEEFRTLVQAKMREKNAEDLALTMNRIKHKTAERLKSLMDDDAIFEKNPFAVVDRGLRVLEGLNVLKTKEGVTINNTQNTANFSLPADSANALVAGLNKANEVKQLHAGVTNQSIE